MTGVQTCALPICADAAIPGVAVADTVKQIDAAGNVVHAPDRSTLAAVQTPQAFRRDWLQEAHRSAQMQGVAGTDDAYLLERMGRPVRVVEGSGENIKVTFTLMPAAITSEIAGRPGLVAGIFIKRFGRLIICHSSFACATVFLVSIANLGSTSIETLPSRPLVLAKTSLNKSHAARTSSVVNC